MTYLLLFVEFFKIGLFIIGGGLAALPFLFDLADKYDWFTAQQLADMVAVSESTPGPLAINMATYAGYSAAGVAGAALATLGTLLPSLLLSLLLCRVLAKFKAKGWMEEIFHGLRPAVAGLITAISLSLLQLALVPDLNTGWASGISWPALGLFAVLLAGVFALGKHPIFYIAIGAAAGILLKL